MISETAYLWISALLGFHLAHIVQCLDCQVPVGTTLFKMHTGDTHIVFTLSIICITILIKNLNDLKMVFMLFLSCISL